jgi:glutamyl-tRNA synthetase/nondiscriminating glutamyl-tRNA synthetase
MGVLPEALVNYLALLGWAPPGGDREIFTPQELIAAFDLDRVTPSPAVFDMEKLYWLNRHYIKESRPDHIHSKALLFFAKAGILGKDVAVPVSSGESFSLHIEESVSSWLSKVTDLLVASADRLDQLPERANFIFHYDAKTALAAPENAEVLGWPHTEAVLARFVFKVLEDESAREGKLTPEQFKKIVNEVKAESGAKGKELFHPIRIAITGSHSGPEFDKLIPILEEGSQLHLPKHVKSVRERVEKFAKERTK